MERLRERGAIGEEGEKGRRCPKKKVAKQEKRGLNITSERAGPSPQGALDDWE